MKKKIVAVLIAAALLATAALAVAGTTGDPFIPLSYLTAAYLPQAEQAVLERAQSATAQTGQAALDKLDALSEGYLERAENRRYADAFTRMTLAAGTRLELTAGAGLLYEAGQMYLSCAQGCLVDLTDGSTVTTGGALTAGHRYLAAEDTACSLFVESDAAYLSLQGFYEIESTGEPATPFVDITPDDWYHSAVGFAYENELFNGVTDITFSPNTNMNRAMLATVLSRLAGADAGKAASAGFADVPDGVWYTAPVNWAAGAGIVNGMGDGTFAPLADVTREQMAVMLYRYARDYLGREVTASGDLSRFPDGAAVPEWAAQAVSWAVDNGIFTGFEDGTLRSGGTATRAQVATMLQRFFALLS